VGGAQLAAMEEYLIDKRQQLHFTLAIMPAKAGMT